MKEGSKLDFALLLVGVLVGLLVLLGGGYVFLQDFLNKEPTPEVVQVACENRYSFSPFGTIKRGLLTQYWSNGKITQIQLEGPCPDTD